MSNAANSIEQDLHEVSTGVPCAQRMLLRLSICLLQPPAQSSFLFSRQQRHGDAALGCIGNMRTIAGLTLVDVQLLHADVHHAMAVSVFPDNPSFPW